MSTGASRPSASRCGRGSPMLLAYGVAAATVWRATGEIEVRFNDAFRSRALPRRGPRRFGRVKLTIDVPVVVDANWLSGATIPTADGRPSGFERDFPGTPRAGLWYPNALANQLHGSDLDLSDSDVRLRFNALRPWHVGANAPPADRFDLTTFVLREFARGIGFSSGLYQISGNVRWDYDDPPSPRVAANVARDRERDAAHDLSVTIGAADRGGDVGGGLLGRVRRPECERRRASARVRPQPLPGWGEPGEPLVLRRSVLSTGPSEFAHDAHPRSR